MPVIRLKCCNVTIRVPLTFAIGSLKRRSLSFIKTGMYSWLSEVFQPADRMGLSEGSTGASGAASSACAAVPAPSTMFAADSAASRPMPPRAKADRMSSAARQDQAEIPDF